MADPKYSDTCIKRTVLLLIPLIFLFFSTYSGVSFKGQAPGKLTGCEGDFVHLVCPSREGFITEKFSSKSFVHLCNPVVLLLNMLMNP